MALLPARRRDRDTDLAAIADVQRPTRALGSRRQRLLVPPSRVTTAQVFAIAGPAMVANLTTPLIGIVSTIAIGRLGDATLLGGVALASVLFDCMFWLFGFLRMSTVGFTVAALIGAGLILLQMPLAALLLGAMGGSEGATHAASTYFTIRIWSSPL